MKQHDKDHISIIRVEIRDKKDRLVPDASDKVWFSVKNGRILGVGNGHPSSHERDVFEAGEPVHRNAFGGLVQVIVASDDSGLPVELTATSPDLKADSLQIQLVNN